ncbi:FlgM family anti-sigma-28 factor [Crenobacter luteus]|uniref:Negative regulator of flagellin synthesis n=1 Tax=Crenobacter luteus TaxID=1452487 RepID=A0A165F6Y5_9NEIS|nr:flagellar biosynthesis anti-sigma factor FlgM [Crenobacter luteus]KZE31749.1 hypothetical protein AVW16_00765 [Crenobacter luteus]TCP15613.1 FlgM family anti-sigma-28 factor [Crenobacter luteus]
MRITSHKPELRDVAAPEARQRVATPAAAPQRAAAETGAAAEVAAAAAGLAALPEVDAARVAEIKAALGRGEIGFDAQKLAALIDAYHGGRM